MKFMKFACIGVLAFAVVSVLGCKKEQTPGKESSKQADTSMSREIAVASKEFLSPEMVQMRQTSHTSMVVFAKGGSGIAYIEPVEGKFRVVHNGKAGRSYAAISELQVSSDGKRVAYAASKDKGIYWMVVDGKEFHEFGADSNHWFTPDGKLHISTATEGNRKYIVIEDTVYDRYSIVHGPLIRPDSAALAFSVRPSDRDTFQFVITDMDLRNETVFESCGQYILPSEDLSRLAVGCEKDGVHIIKTVDFGERRVVSESRVDGEITHMKFSPDDSSLPYTVMRPGYQRYIVWKGREEKIPDGEEFLSDPLVFEGPEGVGVIIGNVYRAWLHFAFQKEKKKEGVYGYVSDLVASKDGRHHAYIGTKQNERQMQIVVDGHEGPKLDKIVSPLFSPDSRLLVYRARQDGKRFLVVSDLRGKIIDRHPDYEMVFQPVFTDDGKSVAYGVLDGNEFWWKVEKL